LIFISPWRTIFKNDQQADQSNLFKIKPKYNTYVQ